MTAQTKQARPRDEQIEFERGLIEEALEEVRSGLRLDEAEVKAWLAGLDGDVDLPIPDFPVRKSSL